MSTGIDVDVQYAGSVPFSDWLLGAEELVCKIMTPCDWTYLRNAHSPHVQPPFSSDIGDGFTRHK
jgi:hypothetical protein